MKKGHSSRNYQTAIEKLEERYALAAAIKADRFENNDSLSTSYNLGSLIAGGVRTYTSLTMDDVGDFYKFTLAQAGTANTKVFVSLIHSEGDLVLNLFSQNGSALRSSDTKKNLETVSLSGLAAGTYIIKVSGLRNAKSPNYKLTLSTTGATPTPLVPTIPDPPKPPTPPTPAPNIDLVGSFLVAPNEADLNTTIDVSSRVKNTGTAKANAFNVQYFLSRDNLVSADDIPLSITTGAGSFIVREFAAGGESEDTEARLILPKTLPTSWTGSNFFVVMKTDSSGQIVETNEANNSGQAGSLKDWQAIKLNPADPNVPDPIISLFNIKLRLTGMSASQQKVFKDAATKWSKIIVGELPNQMYNGVVVDDLLIDAVLRPIDGVSGILGQAGPREFRDGSVLPYYGTMEFDVEDVARMEDAGTFEAVILHEMGHVLGIGTIWGSLGLITGAGTSNPRFIGPRATQAYNQIFGKNDAGVPVENSGGSGTRDSHWSEDILANELMTGYTGPGRIMPISQITVAALADMGYVVNPAEADEYTRPDAMLREGALAGASSSSSTGLSSLVDGAARDQALNSLIGVGPTVGTAKNVSSATVENVKSSSSVVKSNSATKSNLVAKSEVFANDPIDSLRSLASANSLSSATRKSSQNVFETIFASEF